MELQQLSDGVMYLDDIWAEISDNRGKVEAMTNYEMLKELGFTESVATLASQKYPSVEMKEQAIEFAIQIKNQE